MEVLEKTLSNVNLWVELRAGVDEEVLIGVAEELLPLWPVIERLFESSMKTQDWPGGFKRGWGCES